MSDGPPTGPDDAAAGREPDADPVARRPAPSRRDPAAMRETLETARRRLGPAGKTGQHSAERLRALLREAAASQSPPLPEQDPAPPPPPPASTSGERRPDADQPD